LISYPARAGILDVDVHDTFVASVFYNLLETGDLHPGSDGIMKLAGV